LDANANESTLESLIANLAKYPDRDLAMLIEAAAQISESGIPFGKLEDHVKSLSEAAAQISESGIPFGKLEDHVKSLMAEKEMLQREIDKKRAILDGVLEDVESRTKIMEEYTEMKVEMRRYGIGPEDPKRFSNVLQVLQSSNYDCSKILGAFVDVDDVRKLKLDTDHDRLALEAQLEEVKDTLPLALLQYGIGINEVIAFKLAVDEKAYMENIPRGTAAFKGNTRLFTIRRPQERAEQTATNEHDYDN
jgi:hypothetical protein